MVFVFNVIPDLPAFVLRTTAGKKVGAIGGYPLSHICHFEFRCVTLSFRA